MRWLLFFVSFAAQAEDTQKYVDRFYRELANRSEVVSLMPIKAPTISILFSHVRYGFEATCQKVDDAPSEITLDEVTWRKAPEATREMIIFHELGHCALNREHNDTLERGIPVSLMNSAGFSGAIYTADKARYLRELFSLSPMVNQ